MKKTILFIIIVGITTSFYSLSSCNEKLKENELLQIDISTKNRLETELIEVEKLIKSNTKYNSEIGFFIDMKISSGKNRFFIYNIKSKKIIDGGLVAHGSGSETGIKGKLKFSNVDNSLSSSLGKYTIGNSYQGKFGKAYKLYGLDKTNDNAFARNIVLHKYFDVPYEEQKENICNSLGCPMVNEIFYTRIEKIIDSSDKKIILSIYY